MAETGKTWMEPMSPGKPCISSPHVAHEARKPVMRCTPGSSRAGRATQATITRPSGVLALSAATQRCWKVLCRSGRVTMPEAPPKNRFNPDLITSISSMTFAGWTV